MVNQPASEIDHEVLRNPLKRKIGLIPDPERLLRASLHIDLKKLEPLAYQSVLSAKQFTKDMLTELCKLAAYIQTHNPQMNQLLSDKILATAFFEPSTRTRLSFESAMLRLGGKNITVASALSTGVAKGESMRDIGQMFNGYADAVVVRHTKENALNQLSEYLRIPMINGGNGSDEHPTQAIADWYALLKWKPEITTKDLPADEKIHLGIVGTPGNMRTVKSFIILSLLFHKNIKKITVVSELADPLGKQVSQFCEESSIPVEVTNDIQEVVSDLDVVYMNSIALLGEGYQTFGARYNVDSYTKFKKDAVVLHPLARLEELDPSLDDTHHNLYFNQANGAVFVREAILLCVFDRVDQLLRLKTQRDS